MVKLEEPDKGQAWVVAIAAALISMITSGLSRMRALLYVDVIETYAVSRQVAAEPFTVKGVIRNLVGPIIGVIGQRYGVKAATFWGGVIGSMGIALCCIAPNVLWLTVFWGGLFGFGHSLACTLYPVLINQYFVKYRATASGIALSGTSIGSFVLPVITKIVLDTFGLSGGFLIFSAISMHILPLSLLLKSPQWLKSPKQYARLRDLKMKQHIKETLEKGFPEAASKEEVQECRDIKQSSSLGSCPLEELDKCIITRSLKEKTKESNFEKKSKLKGKKSCKSNVICISAKTKESPQLSRKNSSLNGSTVSAGKSYAIPIPTISGDLEKKKSDISSSAPCEKIPEVSSGNKTSLLESIRGIGTVYTNPIFVLICVGSAMCALIYIPVLTIIVDYGKDKGIAESYEVYIVNSVAVGDFIGRLCFGWVTDKNILSIPTYLAISCILKAVFILLLPLVMNLYSYMLLLALYGTTLGTVISHSPLLILRYVDKNLQPVAMGCEGFLSGIVSFAIPSMIGYFRDVVGSYDGMFYLLGTVSVLTGCLWLLIPSLAEFQCKKS